MRIMLINLASGQDRLAFQRAQLKRFGLVFERIDAISGSSVDEKYYAKMAATGPRLMSRNEVACFLSHQLCWNKCVELNQPILVLEDDAVVAPELGTIMGGINISLWDEPLVLNLEMFSPKKRLGLKIQNVQSGYAIYDLIFAGAGAAGYIITPKAARICLAKAQRHIGLADVFLYSQSGIRLTQLVPACVMQMAFFNPTTTLAAAAATSIHGKYGRRPTSFESFVSNPMTRMRRLQSWLQTAWKRHGSYAVNSSLKVTPCKSLVNSFAETQRQLYG